MNEEIQRMRILSARDIPLAVFLAQDMAKKAGLRAQKAATLATAVSELATNIIKYAEHGLLSVRLLNENYRVGIEAIVKDRGPGIGDLELAMKDHVSSSGTLGLGLPGTRRMVDEFDIESTPGEGTTVRIMVWA